MRRVTITGADDAVAPQTLAELSAEFLFVEWGVLFSAKRHGTPRYPSVGWIRQLVEDYGETRISAHLCGVYARGDVLGKLPRYVNHFDRVQINGYEPGGIPGGAPTARPTRILQCRSESDLHRALFDAGLIGGHVLFDPSGGRGESPDRWPIDQPDRVPLGYAGGITPDNVRDVLREIGPCGPDAWIDMESGVRTGDAFDVAKVRAVLEAVAGSGWTS